MMRKKMIKSGSVLRPAGMLSSCDVSPGFMSARFPGDSRPPHHPQVPTYVHTLHTRRLRSGPLGAGGPGRTYSVALEAGAEIASAASGQGRPNRQWTTLSCSLSWDSMARRRGACWGHLARTQLGLCSVIDDSIPWSWLLGFRYRIRDLSFIKNRGRRPSAIFTIQVLPTLPRDVARYLLAARHDRNSSPFFLFTFSP